jgi:hypothetical protein
MAGELLRTILHGLSGRSSQPESPRLPCTAPGQVFLQHLDGQLLRFHVLHQKKDKIYSLFDVSEEVVGTENARTICIARPHRLWLDEEVNPSKAEVLFHYSYRFSPRDQGNGASTSALFIQSALMKDGDRGSAYLVTVQTDQNEKTREKFFQVDDIANDQIEIQLLEGFGKKDAVAFLEKIKSHKKITIDPPPPCGQDDYMASIHLFHLVDSIERTLKNGTTSLYKGGLIY